jgi:hypothetical protein
VEVCSRVGFHVANFYDLRSGLAIFDASELWSGLLSTALKGASAPQERVLMNHHEH